MYEKITQNHELQGKMDEIQEKLAMHSNRQHDKIVTNSANSELFDNEIALTEEFDVIREEKNKCEQLIGELQWKLFEERKEYLELLKYFSSFVFCVFLFIHSNKDQLHIYLIPLLFTLEAKTTMTSSVQVFSYLIILTMSF